MLTAEAIKSVEDFIDGFDDILLVFDEHLEVANVAEEHSDMVNLVAIDHDVTDEARDHRFKNRGLLVDLLDEHLFDFSVKPQHEINNREIGRAHV